MNVEYRTNRDLPCEALYDLFLEVGWATQEKTTQAKVFMKKSGFKKMKTIS